jgi:hypothetical protein
MFLQECLKTSHFKHIHRKPTYCFVIKLYILENIRNHDSVSSYVPVYMIALTTKPLTRTGKNVQGSVPAAAYNNTNKVLITNMPAVYNDNRTPKIEDRG